MKGVVAFLKGQGDEGVQLVFNDVKASDESESPDWKHCALFTSNAYDADALKNLSLSKEQYAEIGENLIVRLLASNGTIK